MFSSLASTYINYSRAGGPRNGVSIAGTAVVVVVAVVAAAVAVADVVVVAVAAVVDVF